MDIKDKEAREVIKELELKVEWLKEVLLKESKKSDAFDYSDYYPSIFELYCMFCFD